MYKLEFKDRLKHERCKQMIRTETYSLVKLKWNEYEDVKDNSFEPLIDSIIKSNESYNILGRAGCGKSTLIKQLQERLTKENKKFITLCPTNKACLVIPNAMTFCKSSNKFKNKKNIKNLNIDYIFVDEISMVHEIYYKFLLIIKQILSKVKFIICGDFKQLPPV
jgi:predicted AAA+ superfamily ATPase